MSLRKSTLKTVVATICMLLAILNAVAIVFTIIDYEVLLETMSVKNIDRIAFSLLAAIMFYLTFGFGVVTEFRRGAIIPVGISLIFLALALTY